MNWDNFKNKFHTSWHKAIKPFIESNECNKIYTFLKKQKGVEIAPKSALTFRTFEQPFKNIRCVVILDEPYSNKQNDLQYADGIPLSCEFVDKIHPHLNAFYDAMEEEFYGLNLHAIKQMDLNFYTNQGVLFLSSSLTTEIGSPGKHKQLWVPFIKYLITNVFSKKTIPIVFIGQDVYEQYAKVMDPIYPYFIVKQSLSKCTVGVPWDTNGVFTRLNKYLWDNTDYDEIMWVNMDVPY
jgi:uracil DNA glycosylase